MKKIMTFLLFIGCINQYIIAQEQKVIFITLDGFRWQELFNGIDKELVNNDKYNSKIEELKTKFDADSPEESRKKILPFIWSYVSKNGIILGDRNQGSLVNVYNIMHFSYPGYNETITGYADDVNIKSNDKILNPNISIFERLNNHPWYKNSVYIFGSWDVFPYIFNYERSKLPINAGYDHAKNPNQVEKNLNKYQDETPKRWDGVRYDIFTHNFALETLKNKKPKILYIGYGETDDFAHNGSYNHYIESANVNDLMIKELWDYTQKDPFYKNQTTFIITTDHGRGIGDDWQHHGSKIKGADQSWIIMFGNKINSINTNGQFYNNQLAETMTKIIGINFKSDKPIGKSIL
ncbi:phosphoglyceromutase [Chishuiella sp.]|uniref:phosphoglyceromutase n=1 Tax=Chishuiella sp. TaxID=1969467 RepID=UPI0028A9321E|nr:phosphoglyceromutase [Chishuiella sp.]